MITLLFVTTGISFATCGGVCLPACATVLAGEIAAATIFLALGIAGATYLGTGGGSVSTVV